VKMYPLLIGAATGYGISVARSEEPFLSKGRWWNIDNALWAFGGSAFAWRQMMIPIAVGRWTATTAIPFTAGRLWALSNWVRLGAPMQYPVGSTGIGFGRAVGGIGLGEFVAAIASAAIVGAVVGTGISYALWGRKGAQQAADFYTGGVLFGTKPNYLGSWANPGYFHIPGNIWKIGTNL